MEEVDANKQLRDDTKRHRDFKELVRHPGWAHFQALLNANIGERTKAVFDPPEEMGTRKDDHNKGACYGLLWARDVVQATIDAYDNPSEPATEEESE